MAIDKDRLLKKYSSMSREELLQERDYWMRMNTDWARTQEFTRHIGMTKGFSITADAIVTNQETIDLIEQVLSDRL